MLVNSQIAPNFYGKSQLKDQYLQMFLAPGRPRNVIDDPFAVRSNRETIAGELLLTLWSNTRNLDVWVGQMIVLKMQNLR